MAERGASCPDHDPHDLAVVSHLSVLDEIPNEAVSLRSSRRPRDCHPRPAGKPGKRRQAFSTVTAGRISVVNDSLRDVQILAGESVRGTKQFGADGGRGRVSEDGGNGKVQRMRLFSFATILTAIAAANCVGSFPASAARLGESRARCLSNDVSGDAAVAACTSAIKRNPKDAKLLVQRGVAWNKTGDYDFAIGDFSKAIRLDPHNASAFFNRGVAREKKGELQESLVDFKRCAELSPSGPEAQIAIERVTVALAAKTPPQTASSAIAEHFSKASDAQAERTSELETPAPKASSSARDDFSFYIPTLFLIAGIGAVAMFMRKGGSRTADDSPLPDNLETEPVAAGEASSAIESDPPLAWCWSEYKGELDKSPR